MSNQQSFNNLVEKYETSNPKDVECGTMPPNYRGIQIYHVGDFIKMYIQAHNDCVKLIISKDIDPESPESRILVLDNKEDIISTINIHESLVNELENIIYTMLIYANCDEHAKVMAEHCKLYKHNEPVSLMKATGDDYNWVPLETEQGETFLNHYGLTFSGHTPERPTNELTFDTQKGSDVDKKIVTSYNGKMIVNHYSDDHVATFIDPATGLGYVFKLQQRTIERLLLRHSDRNTNPLLTIFDLMFVGTLANRGFDLEKSVGSEEKMVSKYIHALLN